MSECFIEPLDVLYLRGNHLFGDAGAHGAALMPPWPSVFAGALRSQLLARSGLDVFAFARGEAAHAVLGTPKSPGSFRLTSVRLARRTDADRIECLYPVPADAVAVKIEDRVVLHLMKPAELPLPGSYALPKVPVLRAKQTKPEAGYWLTESGWRDYLDGRPVEADALVHSRALWEGDPRLGIALDAGSRTAAKSALYTAETVAMHPGCGFAVGIDGAPGEHFDGLLRLGGDGRGARVHMRDDISRIEVDVTKLLADRRCRVVLTSPGLFPEGWKPPGLDADNRFSLGGVSGRLVSANVARSETVSGWNLAPPRHADEVAPPNGSPKPAERAAPTGSVYWLEDLEGREESVRKLVDDGLWPTEDDNPQRRAEGFNRFAFALWDVSHES